MPTDLELFYSTYGLTSSDPGFLSQFDYDNNGVVDGLDYAAFLGEQEDEEEQEQLAQDLMHWEQECAAFIYAKDNQFPLETRFDYNQNGVIDEDDWKTFLGVTEYYVPFTEYAKFTSLWNSYGKETSASVNPDWRAYDFDLDGTVGWSDLQKTQNAILLIPEMPDDWVPLPWGPNGNTEATSGNVPIGTYQLVNPALNEFEKLPPQVQQFIEWCMAYGNGQLDGTLGSNFWGQIKDGWGVYFNPKGIHPHYRPMIVFVPPGATYPEGVIIQFAPNAATPTDQKVPVIKPVKTPTGGFTRILRVAGGTFAHAGTITGLLQSGLTLYATALERCQVVQDRAIAQLFELRLAMDEQLTLLKLERDRLVAMAIWLDFAAGTNGDNYLQDVFNRITAAITEGENRVNRGKALWTYWMNFDCGSGVYNVTMASQHCTELAELFNDLSATADLWQKFIEELKARYEWPG